MQGTLSKIADTSISNRKTSGSRTLDIRAIGMFTNATNGYLEAWLPWDLDTTKFNVSVEGAYMELVGNVTSNITNTLINDSSIRVTLNVSGQAAYRPAIGSLSVKITQK